MEKSQKGNYSQTWNINLKLLVDVLTYDQEWDKWIEDTWWLLDKNMWRRWYVYDTENNLTLLECKV